MLYRSRCITSYTRTPNGKRNVKVLPETSKPLPTPNNSPAPRYTFMHIALHPALCPLTPTLHLFTRAIHAVHRLHPRRLPRRETRVATSSRISLFPHYLHKCKISLPRIIRIIHVVLNVIQPAHVRATILTSRAPTRRSPLRRGIAHRVPSSSARRTLKDMEETEPVSNFMSRGAALIERCSGSTGDGLREDLAAVLNVGGAAWGSVGWERADA